MAQQDINLGASANDGTGDPLRTGGQKIQDNFTELYGRSDGNIPHQVIPAAVNWDNLSDTVGEVELIWSAVNASPSTIVKHDHQLFFRTLRNVYGQAGSLTTYDIYETYWLLKDKLTVVDGNNVTLGTGQTQLTASNGLMTYAGRKITKVVNGSAREGGFTVDFGATGATPIEDLVSAAGPYDTSLGLYLFKGNDGTNDYLYIYNGLEDEIGTGTGVTLGASDFTILTEATANPAPTNAQTIKLQGDTGSGEFPLAIDFVGADVTEDVATGHGVVTITGGLVVQGEYSNNTDATNAGLSVGDVYSLPKNAENQSILAIVVEEIFTGEPTVNDLQKQITITSTSAQTNYPVYLQIFNTSGTDGGNQIYLNGNVRDDWGDIRFTDSSGDGVAFGIIEKQADNILIVLQCDLINGDTIYNLQYGAPTVANQVVKIAGTTDQHYEPGTTYAGRDLALTRLDNFVTEVGTYEPDIIFEGGDKVGETITDQQTRSANMQLVSDKHLNAATASGVQHMYWGWGNHDFEFESFAQMLAQYGNQPYMETGVLYGSWSDDFFTYINLDTNYDPVDDTHMSNEHQGFGYVDAAQITWLTNILNAATKPCIITAHHPLAEFDTEKLFLTKETYHTQNRAAIRDVLEASGKVAFVMHGHTHAAMVNTINGIPYFSTTDLNDPPPATQGWDTPSANLEGRWFKIEIDRFSQIIRFIQEVRVSGVVYTNYDYRLPYKTIFNDDYGSNIEETLALGYDTDFEKPAIVVDASDLYVNDDLFVVCKPSSIFDSDYRLSDRTIKIYGITDSPDLGRLSWDFPLQTGVFSFKFTAYLEALGYLIIKLEKRNENPAGPLFGFIETGEFRILNGTNPVNAFTYTINTRYDIEVICNVAAKTYSVIVNGIAEATDYSFFNNLATPLGQIEIQTQSGEYFIDSMRVEKYVEPEPTVSTIGSETSI